MNYIVFDLEWNQCPDGKEKEIKDMPFEIIEIGAVKLDSQRRVIDTFAKNIAPGVYQTLHPVMQDLIGTTMGELVEKGVPFPQAVKEFMEWCRPLIGQPLREFVTFKNMPFEPFTE